LSSQECILDRFKVGYEVGFQKKEESY